MKLKEYIAVLAFSIAMGGLAGFAITAGVGQRLALKRLYSDECIKLVCLAEKTDRNAAEVGYTLDIESRTLWIKADGELIRLKPKTINLFWYEWEERE